MKSKTVQTEREDSRVRTTYVTKSVKCCSFPVVVAILWNTLPVDVQSSPSLPVFRQRLKTLLFHKSFPDVVWQADYAFVDLVMAYCYLSHVKNFLTDWNVKLERAVSSRFSLLPTPWSPAPTPSFSAMPATRSTQFSARSAPFSAPLTLRSHAPFPSLIAFLLPSEKISRLLHNCLKSTITDIKMCLHWLWIACVISCGIVDNSLPVRFSKLTSER